MDAQSGACEPGPREACALPRPRTAAELASAPTPRACAARLPKDTRLWLMSDAAAFHGSTALFQALMS